MPAVFVLSVGADKHIIDLSIDLFYIVYELKQTYGSDVSLLWFEEFDRSRPARRRLREVLSMTPRERRRLIRLQNPMERDLAFEWNPLCGAGLDRWDDAGGGITARIPRAPDAPILTLVGADAKDVPETVH